MKQSSIVQISCDSILKEVIFRQIFIVLIELGGFFTFLIRNVPYNISRKMPFGMPEISLGRIGEYQKSLPCIYRTVF